MKILLASIRLNGDTQPRVSLNEAVVAEYAELIRDGVVFPPVTVFFDGAEHWLADGFHRYHAHRAAGQESIAVESTNGTRRDAVLFSVGANGAHGLRRTNEDKRRAVETLLEDQEWSTWPQTKIAKACGVSREFVSRVASLTCDRSHVSVARPPDVPAAVHDRAEEIQAAGGAPRYYKDRHGNASVMDVGSISRANKGRARPDEGRSAEEKPAPDERILTELASVKETLAEQSSQFDETLAENLVLQKVVDADDKLAEAGTQIKQLVAENRVLRERVNGLMNEAAEAKRLAKFWRAKAERAERAAA